MTAYATPLVLAAPCPKCGAKVDESCAEAMRRAVLDDKTLSPVEIDNRRDELAILAAHAPHLAHEERHQELERLVDSAEAYGLVKRVKQS
jgi:hypothetical protein